MIRQPEGAATTRCGNCSFTYGTHAAWCHSKMDPQNFPRVQGDNPCAHHHTVNKELFSTKSALHDGLECRMPVKCIVCGFEVSQLPEMQFAVFGLPPVWFVRIFKNLAGECIAYEDDKPGRRK